MREVSRVSTETNTARGRAGARPALLLWALVVCGLLAVALPQGAAAQGSAMLAQSEQAALLPKRTTSLERNMEELTRTISVAVDDAALETVLHEIVGQTGLQLSFSRELVPSDLRVSLDMENVSVLEALWAALDGTGLQTQVSWTGHLILTPAPAPRTPAPTDIPPLQLGSIAGVVVDAGTGDPLPGVNVVIDGTTQGASTAADGSYEIPGVTPGIYSVRASFIGYQSQIVEDVEVQADYVTELNFEMRPDAIGLEEVVVVGYGVQRRSEVTGSVGIASKDDLEQPSFNALKSLRGKVAGVNIFTNSGSPTGENRVVIRGIGSINASAAPLYVVDGVVMENIELMNPNDIESIEVLKDASATAIYGARGANGVIMITTARGNVDEGDVVVGYSANVSAGQMRGKMDAMNSAEFMEVQRIAYENAPLFNDYAPGEEPVLKLADHLFDENGNPLYDTDWQEEATRTAVSHDHQLSVQAGGRRQSFGGFLNYTNQQGIFLNSYMRRANAKLAYDAEPTDWLSVGTNLSINRTWANDVTDVGGGHAVGRTIIEYAPIFPVKWPDGTWSNSTHTEGGSIKFPAQPNPVHRLLEEDRLRDRIQFFGNSFLTFHISPNLEFRTQLGVDNRVFEARNYGPRNMVTAGFPDGRASITNSETTYWQNENFITYRKELGSHRVNTMVGASWQQELSRGNSFSVRGFANDFFRYNSVGTATEVNPPSSFANDWTMNSYFTRVNYSYAGKYSATVTGRADGSSRFGANSKFGFFPSVGVAWLVSEEPFMQGIRAIDQLRLRSSYGVTGNTEIGLYQSLATIGSGTTLIDGLASSSFVQRLPNPDLEWEKTQQVNVGLELAVLNHRVSLEADYYYKLTTDLLLERPVPTTTGFGSIMDNIGSLSNRGVDFMLTTRNVRTSDFLWTTTLNFNYNRNRIESLGANDEDIFPGPNWVSGSQTILRVGEPIGTFYGFERLGTWGTDEAEEAAAAGYLPGEAKRSAERTIIGHGMPEWTGSFINRFNVGNFDVTADVQFVFGGEIMQQFLHSAEDRMAHTNGLATQLYNAWTEENQDTPYQRIRHTQLSGQNTQADSHWIVDGSYIRGNLFSLGYSFDDAMLARFGMQALRLSLNLENAFVLHSDEFKGYDPEATSWGGNQFTQNIFFYQYPKPRTLTIGFDARF